MMIIGKILKSRASFSRAVPTTTESLLWTCRAAPHRVCSTLMMLQTLLWVNLAELSNGSLGHYRCQVMYDGGSKRKIAQKVSSANISAERLRHWCSKRCSGSTVVAGDPIVMVVEMMVMWYDGGGDF